MKTYETILYEKNEGVATVTLNRPEVLNAINMQMHREITEAFADAEEDRDIRVVILTGQGRAFCAGADLKELSEIFADPDRQKAFYENLPNTFDVVANSPKPVICAINGVATAGGLELVLSCDIVIASEEARIGDRHAAFVGIGPIFCSIAPRKMMFMKAVELALTGDIWTASECEKAGLVNYVVPPDKLEAKAKEIAAKLTDKMPLGSRAIKNIIKQTMEGDAESALRVAHREQQALGQSKDHAEGMKAFAEKRKPVFTGE
jgi:enoyl-CoA hydratase/carnithine racemase